MKRQLLQPIFCIFIDFAKNFMINDDKHHTFVYKYLLCYSSECFLYSTFLETNKLIMTIMNAFQLITLDWKTAFT